MLLVEESDNAGLYSAEERDELLWRIFEHMVLGGSCCQFEVGGAGGGRPGATFAAVVGAAVLRIMRVVEHLMRTSSKGLRSVMSELVLDWTRVSFCCRAGQG